MNLCTWCCFWKRYINYAKEKWDESKLWVKDKHIEYAGNFFGISTRKYANNFWIIENRKMLHPIMQSKHCYKSFHTLILYWKLIDYIGCDFMCLNIYHNWFEYIYGSKSVTWVFHFNNIPRFNPIFCTLNKYIRMWYYTFLRRRNIITCKWRVRKRSRI